MNRSATGAEDVVAEWLAGHDFPELELGDTANDTAIVADPAEVSGDVRPPRRPWQLICVHGGIGGLQWRRRPTRAQAVNSAINRRRLAIEEAERHDEVREVRGLSRRSKPRSYRMSRRERVEALFEQADLEGLVLPRDYWRRIKVRAHCFSFAGGSTTIYAEDNALKLDRLLELGHLHSQPGGKNRQLMRFVTSIWDAMAFSEGRTNVLLWRDASNYNGSQSNVVTIEEFIAQRPERRRAG
jgi:hypothetical protein